MQGRVACCEGQKHQGPEGRRREEEGRERGERRRGEEEGRRGGKGREHGERGEMKERGMRGLGSKACVHVCTHCVHREALVDLLWVSGQAVLGQSNHVALTVETMTSLVNEYRHIFTQTHK